MTGIRLTFWGAAGQVTGSMHLLEAAGGRFLLDAGLFQGRRRRDPRAQRPAPVRPAPARRRGAEPRAHRPRGPAAAAGAARLPRADLRDARHPRPLRRSCCPTRRTSRRRTTSTSSAAARRAPESEPLYNLADAVAVQELMVGVPYRRITHLRKHLALEFVEAGHILGSASVDLRISEGGNHRIVFSGDIGRSGLPIIRDPEPPSGPIDTLIVESTYADRDHESVAGAEERLGEAVRRTAARGGKILDPGLRARPGAGARLQPAPALPRAAGSRRSRSTSTARSRWTPRPCSGCIRRSSTSASGWSAEALDAVRLPARCATSATWPASKALNQVARPGGHHRGERAWRSRAGSCTTWPTASATTATWSSSSASRRSTRSAGGSRAARRSSASWARSTRAGPRSRPSAATRRTPTATELRAWVRRLGGPIRRAFVVHGEAPGLGGDGRDPPGGRGARGRSCRSTARAFDL